MIQKDWGEEVFSELWKRKAYGKGCLIGPVTLSLGTEPSCGDSTEKILGEWPPDLYLFLFLISCLLDYLHWTVQEASWWSSPCWFWSISNFLYTLMGYPPENLTGSQLAADGGMHTGRPPGYRVEEYAVHVVGLTKESQHSLQEQPFSFFKK